MLIEKIKPMPKYIEKLIKAKDKKLNPKPLGNTRYYAYLTKNDGELVKVTVAVRHYHTKWMCKQVAIHGIHSDSKEFIGDLISKELIDEKMNSEIKSEKMNKEINIEIEIYNLGGPYWRRLIEEGLKRKILSPDEVSLLKIAASVDTPNPKIASPKQAKLEALRRIYAAIARILQRQEKRKKQGVSCRGVWKGC